MLAFDIPTIWPSMKTQDDEPTKPGARKEALARPFLTGLIDDPTLVIDMINFLHSTRRTGVLTVIDGEARKSLFFAQGSLIAGASNLQEDRFGNVMVRMGLISLDGLEHALKDVGPQRRIGNVLLSRGLLSTKDLWRIVRVQIEEILFSILLLEKGEFNVAHYEPGQVPSRTALNTQHVLLEGLRRKDEMEHLRGAMPPRDRLLVRTRRERNLSLNPNERRVYDLVDGVRQVGEVCRESGLGELEATRLIHHLLKIGLITEATNVEVVPGEAGGCGRLGLAIVHELEAKNAPFVAIERDPELIETLRAASPRLLLVQGDAGEDDVLIAAGVKRARALVAALNDDASNVFLTLTARVLNAKVVIHGKADDPDTLRKLERAGANHPFSPSLVAGQRIAAQLTRPTVAELVGVVTSITDQELSIEEVPASAVRGLVGRPLSESPLWGQPRTLVLAVKKADGRLLFPALADYVVVSHDYLVLMGEPARLRLLVDPSGT